VRQTTRLSIVLALNIFMIAGLLFVGLSSHSIGVLAAGGDYLLDCSAITLGLLAIYIRDRAKGNSKATTIVALVNSAFLLIITAYVVFEAVHRLSGHTPKINALPVLIVSSIAAVFMVVGAFIIGGDDDDDDLHMRSVLLDTISDAVAAAALAITGAIILLTKGFYWADSVVALLIAVAIAYQALRLLRDVVRELRGRTSRSH
jgi:cobalt-zinc-cadmium efflux system protein